MEEIIVTVDFETETWLFTLPGEENEFVEFKP
jgi:hypothetical protein